VDLGALRSLITKKATDKFGVPATVTVRLQSPISTRVIWVIEPAPEDLNLALDHQRLDPRRIAALDRTAVSKVPVGTKIEAPEKSGGATKIWRVEEVVRMTADEIRVSVIEVDPIYGGVS
jgi:hypothetical protein